MEDSAKKQVICCKCNIPLELGKTEISYQGYQLTADLLRCPGCGQVFISEELVKGRMLEVEKELEEK
jgi:uncharacterized protein with PIN domain